VRKHRESNFKGFYEAIINKAMAYNDFSATLGISEVTATAKSISKWVWTRDGRAEEAFIKRQRWKQTKSVESRLIKTQDKREQAIELSLTGMSTREIATMLSVNQSTIVRWIKGDA
jgi:DNA-binding NarL/FixJ family response regulator